MIQCCRVAWHWQMLFELGNDESTEGKICIAGHSIDSFLQSIQSHNDQDSQL